MKSRFNPILLTIIVIGLCFASWLTYERYQVEKHNNTVELAMDYESVRRMAYWEGYSTKDLLKAFKAAGLTTLVVYDTTLERLNERQDIVAVSGMDLLNQKQFSESSGIFKPLLVSGKIIPQAVYIAANEESETFQEMITDLYNRYGRERVSVIAGDTVIVEVKGKYTATSDEDALEQKPGLLQAPLGLSTKELKEIKDAGFLAIVRTQNFAPSSRAGIDTMFNRIAQSGATVTEYLPTGKDVMGYPDNVYYMGRKLSDYRVRLGLPEHFTQLQFTPFNGLVNLAEQVNYNAVRVYTIDRLENRKIPMPEGLRRWALADEERNIRVNYIRPFMQPQEGNDIVELNLDYVNKIATNVKARGYTLAAAGVFEQLGTEGKLPFKPYFPDRYMFIPLAFAIMAAAMMYFGMIFDISIKKQILMTFVLGLVASLTIVLSRGLMTRQILAFCSAVFFPVLSMGVIMELWKANKDAVLGNMSILFKAIWQLALAVTLAFIGATFIAAILGDSRFFLEIDIYRGVKLTFITPVVLVSLLYLKTFDVFGEGSSKLSIPQQIMKVTDIKLSYAHLLGLGALLFVAYVFVGRSGHTAGMAVPALEIKLRLFLEQVMYARPREKEFLIGHPAFFMAVLAFYKGAPKLWQMLLTIGGTIGVASLVQTFTHMRTPAIMSYIRGIDGYFLGAIIGTIAFLVVVFLLPYAKEWKRRYLINE